MQTLIGSEGTLGIITEATMRLEPLPEGRRFLSFQFPSRGRRPRDGAD